MWSEIFWRCISRENRMMVKISKHVVLSFQNIIFNQGAPCHCEEQCNKYYCCCNDYIWMFVLLTESWNLTGFIIYDIKYKQRRVSACVEKQGDRRKEGRRNVFLSVPSMRSDATTSKLSSEIKLWGHCEFRRKFTFWIFEQS